MPRPHSASTSLQPLTPSDSRSHEHDHDSDSDLALDELDPIPAADHDHLRPSQRSSRHAPARTTSPSLGRLGAKIKLHKLRSTSPSLSSQAYLPLVGHDDHLPSTSIDQLRSSEPDHLDRNLDSHRHSDHSLNATPPLPVSTHPRSRWSALLSKLRSTPQSEIEKQYGPAKDRAVAVGHRQSTKYPPNLVSNAKYTPWSFLPRTLYHEFSFFLNLYFLLVALSQIIPQLRIGYLSTYVAPLAFVLTITIGKEAIDDIARRKRDAEANSERYTVVSMRDAITSRKKTRPLRPAIKREAQANGNGNHLQAIAREELLAESDGDADSAPPWRQVSKTSRDLKVGDILQLGKDQRVPADVVLLKTLPSDNLSQPADSTAEAFIRTDQLDGETDWKLRLPPPLTQSLDLSTFSRIQVKASKPERHVNEFVGSLALLSSSTTSHSSSGTASYAPDDPSAPADEQVPLTIDNTAWANTVLASGCTVLAAVIYTGPQTRQAMSTSTSRTKTGLLEYEINSLTKILCLLTLFLSLLLVAVEKFETPDGRLWYVAVLRFLILFSTIVPISLRVNLDLGKSVYAWFIQRDQDIPETVVRSSTIPEDLGRIEYLLSDKTGTLTQNDMQLRKVHVGTVSYANEAMSEVSGYIKQGFASEADSALKAAAMQATATRSRREIAARVRDLVLALAICHNVTPTTTDEDGKTVVTYQASSPDEIAIVRWTESVGLRLAHRDRQKMTLESVHTGQVVYQIDILTLFPFTSEGKRMGILVKFHHPEHQEHQPLDSETVWFFQKGADTVMSSIVTSNDWLDEETANMAREGLRTLVVGRKKLSQTQYEEFAAKYREASVVLHDRDAAMANVVKLYLEHDVELLGVTGVEDKLQLDVKPSLELLRNAGVKIWMLTGDKVETARCVAISSKLVARGQYVHTITKLRSESQAEDSIQFLHSKPDACLLIDGESLGVFLANHREAFISVAVKLSSVVACRCSPIQKAQIAKLIRTYTKKRVCCIGDGGNDVSMIQEADVGVGIVGKEGRQASLAADFSILQFCYLTKLLMWHGRNSYKRSAKLSQFVIHRGLIIAVCQTVYSIAIVFRPEALYRDWLLVGYATVYTMAPVFSLVLDTDIPPRLAHVYPELYAELSTSRSLSYRTFFIWVGISVYQGIVIQLLSQFLVPIPLDHVATRPGEEGTEFQRMVSVSFTVLIINELVMVAAEVTTWHWIMIASIFGTAAVYFGSLPFLGEYFDLKWILTLSFLWRVIAIAAVSLVPVYAMKIVRRLVKPPSYRRVQQGI